MLYLPVLHYHAFFFILLVFDIDRCFACVDVCEKVTDPIELESQL